MCCEALHGGGVGGGGAGGSKITIVLAVDLRQKVNKGVMSELMVSISNEAALTIRKQLAVRMASKGLPTPPTLTTR